MTNTELETVTQGELALVKGSFELSVVAAKISEPAPPDGSEPQRAFPKLPDPFEPSVSQREALRVVHKAFGTTHLERRRPLGDQERTALATEEGILDEVIKAATKRRDEIKEMVRVHIDVTAELMDQAVPRAQLDPAGVITAEATQRDLKGHYLLAAPEQPWPVTVPGFKKGWQQTYTSGSVSLSGALLAKLLGDGLITRKEYLACTREVRALDEARLNEFIRRDPVRGLGILKAITERSAPNSALQAPEE